MKSISDFFKIMFEENKLSHSFLIGNTSLNNIYEELEKIISLYVFSEKTTLKNNPDIHIIKTEEENVSKYKIKLLINKLRTTSQLYNKKVYIISGVENLNDHVYNTMLKTLEEPGNNIYAFLISSNIDMVPETIKSRCQIIFVSTENEYTTNQEIYKLAYEFINKIETTGYKSSSYYNEIYKKIENRDMFKNVLQEMYLIYFNLMYNKIGILGKEKDNKLLSLSTDSLCKKILTINSYIEKNKINFNKDLLIDKLILDLWRCNDEISVG